MSYLVDTDTCSAFIRGNRAVWPKFMQYFGRIHVSTITAAELWTWVLKPGVSSAREQGVRDLLNNTNVLPVDLDVARRFGEVRANQLVRGTVTPSLDLLIASTALCHNLTLVTHNTADYATIPGLSLDDWLPP